MLKSKELELKIKHLEDELNSLKRTVVTKELEVLRENKKRLDEIESNLKNIRITVKTASYVENQNGQKYVKIIYEVPTQYVAIKDDGRPVRNEMFRSINQLSLLNEESFAKIRKALDEAEKNVDF